MEKINDEEAAIVLKSAPAIFKYWFKRDGWKFVMMLTCCIIDGYFDSEHSVRSYIAISLCIITPLFLISLFEPLSILIMAKLKALRVERFVIDHKGTVYVGHTDYYVNAKLADDSNVIIPIYDYLYEPLNEGRAFAIFTSKHVRLISYLSPRFSKAVIESTELNQRHYCIGSKDIRHLYVYSYY